MKNKWIIIPSEVKVRDFESRLLLASYLAINNYNIIFGSQHSIQKHILNLPRGLYFDKSISLNKINWLKKITTNGFLLSSIDEEGLCSFNNTYFYLKARVTEEALNLTTRVFTWGKSEADIITNEYKNVNGKVCVSGNPRVDLWRPEFRKIYSDIRDKYKKKYGNYILIPSSFGTKHVGGETFIMDLAKKFKRFKTEDEKQKYIDRQKCIRKQFDAFLKMIPVLAEYFPNYKLIIRPHPSEDLNYWNDFVKDIPNAEMVFEGNITPWLCGADLIVHSTCTTGLEAFLLNTPVISYLPYTDHKYFSHIANEVSYKTHTVDDLLKLAADILNKKIDISVHREETLKFLEYHLESFKGKLAIQLIKEEIDKIELPLINRNILKLYRIKMKINILISFFKKIIKNSLKKDNRKSIYSEQKFPGVNLIEVKQFLFKLAQVKKDFSQIHIKKITEDLFFIKK